jgi:hypothetical protein
MTTWVNDELNSGGVVKLYNDASTTYDASDTTYNGKARAIWSKDTRQTTSWSNESKSATTYINELKS